MKLEDDKNLPTYKIQQGATLDLRDNIQIKVNTPRGRTITLDVMPEETIEAVKAKIQAKEGIPPEQQRLIFSSMKLENDGNLATYNIHDGATLELRECMQVHVRTITVKWITLDVEPEETIDALKSKIQGKNGIPPAQQRLIFDRHTLENNHPLSTNNIQHGSTIDLSDGMQIYVKTPKGNIIALDVEPYDTINSLKGKIQTKEGIPAEQQILLFGGCELEDGNSLAILRIPKGTTLQLLKVPKHNFTNGDTSGWPQLPSNRSSAKGSAKGSVKGSSVGSTKGAKKKVGKSMASKPHAS